MDPSLLGQLDDYSIFALLLALQQGDTNSPYLTELEILTTLAHVSLEQSPFLSPLVWSEENLALLYPSHIVGRPSLHHICHSFFEQLKKLPYVSLPLILADGCVQNESRRRRVIFWRRFTSWTSICFL